MTVLRVPISDNVFPPISLTDAQIFAYQKQSREKVNQLIRIAEDADCVYKWAEIISKSGKVCFKARINNAVHAAGGCTSPFLAFPTAHTASNVVSSLRGENPYQQVNKNTQVLLKSCISLHASYDEVLEAIARVSTAPLQKSCQYLYPSTYLDCRTLMQLQNPSGTESQRGRTTLHSSWGPVSGRGSRKGKRADNNVMSHCKGYQAIKWYLYGQHRSYKRRNIVSSKHIKLSAQQYITVGKSKERKCTPTNGSLHSANPNDSSQHFAHLRRSLITPRDHARKQHNPTPASNSSLTARIAVSPISVLPSTALDMCVLEYACTFKEFCASLEERHGNKEKRGFRPPNSSNILALCVQSSLQKENEIHSLDTFGIARAHVSLFGFVIAKTSRSDVVTVTALCQLDTDVNPSQQIMKQLEQIMIENVSQITRLQPLIERQRMSRLLFVEQWQWIPNAERKVCAVCLRSFFLHRKHHCRACGEVVCSFCAPLRDLELPIADITSVRVCCLCVSINPRYSQISSSGKMNKRQSSACKSYSSHTSSRRATEKGPPSIRSRASKSRDSDNAQQTEGKCELGGVLDPVGTRDTSHSSVEMELKHSNPSPIVNDEKADKNAHYASLSTLSDARSDSVQEDLIIRPSSASAKECVLTTVADRITQVRKVMQQTFIQQDAYAADSEAVNRSSTASRNSQNLRSSELTQTELKSTFASVFVKGEKEDDLDADEPCKEISVGVDAFNEGRSKIETKSRQRRKRKSVRAKITLHNIENGRIDSVINNQDAEVIDESSDPDLRVLSARQGSNDYLSFTQEQYVQYMNDRIEMRAEMSRVPASSGYHNDDNMNKSTHSVVDSRDIERLEEKIIELQRSLLHAHEKLQQIDGQIDEGEPKQLSSNRRQRNQSSSTSRSCSDFISGYFSGYTSGYSSEYTSTRSSLNDSQHNGSEYDSGIEIRKCFDAIDEHDNVDTESRFDLQQRRRQEHLRQHALSRQKGKRIQTSQRMQRQRKSPVTTEMICEIFDVMDSSERSESTQVPSEHVPMPYSSYCRSSGYASCESSSHEPYRQKERKMSNVSKSYKEEEQLFELRKTIDFESSTVSNMHHREDMSIGDRPLQEENRNCNTIHASLSRCCMRHDDKNRNMFRSEAKKVRDTHYHQRRHFSSTACTSSGACCHMRHRSWTGDHDSCISSRNRTRYRRNSAATEDIYSEYPYRFDREILSYPQKYHSDHSDNMNKSSNPCRSSFYSIDSRSRDGLRSSNGDCCECDCSNQRRKDVNTCKDIQAYDCSPRETMDHSLHMHHDVDRNGIRKNILTRLWEHILALRSECSDSLFRCRKLQSIRKILHRILLRGEKSGFLALDFDIVRYPEILDETPSIIQILELAGFVLRESMFLMQYIERSTIASIVAELDREIQTNLMEI